MFMQSLCYSDFADVVGIYLQRKAIERKAEKKL